MVTTVDSNDTQLEALQQQTQQPHMVTDRTTNVCPAVYQQSPSMQQTCHRKPYQRETSGAASSPESHLHYQRVVRTLQVLTVTSNCCQNWNCSLHQTSHQLGDYHPRNPACLRACTPTTPFTSRPHQPTNPSHIHQHHMLRKQHPTSTEVWQTSNHSMARTVPMKTHRTSSRHSTE